MTVIGIPIFKILFKNKHFVESIRIDLSNNSYLDKINNNVLNSAKSSVK